MDWCALKRTGLCWTKPDRNKSEGSLWWSLIQRQSYQPLSDSLTWWRSGLCPEHSQSGHQHLAGAYFPPWDPSSGSAASRKNKLNPGVTFTAGWTEENERERRLEEPVHPHLSEIFYYKLAKQKRKQLNLTLSWLQHGQCAGVKMVWNDFTSVVVEALPAPRLQLPFPPVLKAYDTNTGVKVNMQHAKQTYFKKNIHTFVHIGKYSAASIQT